MLDVFGEEITISYRQSREFINNYLIQPALATADKVFVALVEKYNRGDLFCQLCIIDQIITKQN